MYQQGYMLVTLLTYKTEANLTEELFFVEVLGKVLGQLLLRGGVLLATLTSDY
jgi:hypothetical protein